MKCSLAGLKVDFVEWLFGFSVAVLYICLLLPSCAVKLCSQASVYRGMYKHVCGWMGHMYMCISLYMYEWVCKYVLLSSTYDFFL